MSIRITRSKDCGNSPKQKLLQDLAIAIGSADTELVKRLTAEDVSWCHSGRASLLGQAAVLKGLEKIGSVDTIEIIDVVSHGKKGAVRGIYAVSGKQRAFSHFIEFTNNKCTEVMTINTMSAAAR